MDHLDVLVTDPVSGGRTGLARTVRRALRAMQTAEIPYCVVGATALAVRGLPRMTRDLDIVVMIDDARPAIDALLGTGFRASTPILDGETPESMIVFVDDETGVDVDLLVAAGDPEATVCEQAPTAKVFGVTAPVATAEHLLLMYLYSNQPRHLGDFAAIVTSRLADLAQTERLLAVMHPEMLAEWKRRVTTAQTPAPPAGRPPPRKRR